MYVLMYVPGTLQTGNIKNGRVGIITNTQRPNKRSLQIRPEVVFKIIVFWSSHEKKTTIDE